MQTFKFNSTTLFICVLGIIVSTTLYFQTKKIEENILKERFNATATTYFLTISHGFLSADDHVMHFTQSLENELVLEGKDKLSAINFNFLSQILPWGESGISATAWAPLLTRSEFADFKEKEAEKHQLKRRPNHKIHPEDISLISGFAAAPVQLSRIEHSTDMFPNLNLVRMAEFLQAFKSSISNQAPSTILHAGEMDDGESAISFIHPIPSQSNSTSIIGFAIAEWNLKTLLESTLIDLPAKGVHIQLWDQQGEQSELVAKHTSRLDITTVPSLFLEIPLHFIDRHFKFRFTASPAYINNYAMHYSSYVLFIGLLLTIISALVFTYSARQRFEENSYNKLSAAIQHIGQAIIITDKNGTIEYANPAFLSMTGYSESEVLGQNPRIINSAKQPPEFYKKMWQTILSGNIWRGSVIEKRKNGSRYPASLTISPIFDKNNEVTHFVGIHDDLSIQKDLEEQLHQAQKMEAIGTLISGVAHNFNNSLAGIMGSAYLAQQDTTSPTALTHLNRIEHLSESAADMISQLLLFSQKGYAKMADLSFSTLMREGIKTARFTLPDDVNLSIDICDDPLMVHGNASQLQQALINLISNGRDALPEQGKRDIKISVYAAKCDSCRHHKGKMGDVAVLSVQDSGCGIDLESMANIFEPFYTTKTVGAGTGLGLSTLYGSIQSHGGAVHVDSTLHAGSTFKICLPLIHANNKNDTVIATKVHTAKSKKGILVIDDEKVIRTMLDSILSSLGYKVYLANNGKEGTHLFSQHQDDIALLITDIVMPVMDGYDVASSIRQQNPDMPVIFITAYENLVSSDKTMPDDQKTKHMQKPFNVPDLSRLVAELIERHST